MPNSISPETLATGGILDEPFDSIAPWLSFITDPKNLKPGLPDLTVYFDDARFNWIEVKFDSTRPSLRSFTLELNYLDDEYARSLFTEWVLMLFEHSELQHLRVAFPIPELPDLFHKIPKLKSIDLTDAALIRLPDSFYRLPALETLIIHGVPLPELPSEVCNIYTLRELTFSQPCSPTALANFPNLEHLTYWELKTTYDFYFTEVGLPNLKQLHTNNIEAFKNVLDQFTKLKALSISGKVSEVMHSKISQLKNVRIS